MTGIIVLIVVAVSILAVIGLYNQLVRQKNLVGEAWSGIDVQLKRRHDLVPNIVETVKGYASHEKGLFEKVAQLRTQAMSATSVQDKGAAENAITQSLKSLFALAEAYPNLKANENFLSLHKSLAEIEDHIQMARRYYNGAARDLNTTVQSFPANMLAPAFRFTVVPYFELETATERQVPEVKLS